MPRFSLEQRSNPTYLLSDVQAGQQTNPLLCVIFRGVSIPIRFTYTSVVPIVFLSQTNATCSPSLEKAGLNSAPGYVVRGIVLIGELSRCFLEREM